MQQTGDRKRKADDRGQMTEGRIGKPGNQGNRVQEPEGRRQMTDGRGQSAERGRKMSGSEYGRMRNCITRISHHGGRTTRREKGV